jgi:hypothetical protein
VRNALLTLLLFGLLSAHANPAGFYEGLTAARLRGNAVGPVPSVPTDYQHYWHPSKYGDGLDRGNSSVPLNATNIVGSVTVGSNGWTIADSANGSYITTGPVTNGTDYTVALWTRYSSTGGTAGWLINDGDTKVDWQLVALNDSSGIFQPAIVNATGAVFTVNTASLGTNWLHIAVTFGGSNITAYVNGEYHTNSIYTGSPSTLSARHRIGSHAITPITAAQLRSRTYRGNIDKYMFFNRVLTADEIELLADQPRAE